MSQNGYYECGMFLAHEGWMHPERIKDFSVLLFGLQGRYGIIENDDIFVVDEGDAMILQAKHIHRGYPLETSTIPKYYWVHFYQDPPEWKHFHLPNPSQAAILFKYLLHVTNTRGYEPGMPDQILSLIFQEINYQYSEQSIRSTAILYQIREWIRNHITDPIRLEDLAKEFGYNTLYLSRIFKEQFHIGLKQYINTERINLINNYLIATDLPLKTIAEETGFPSYESFLKFYRYNEKITPSQHRESFIHTYINLK